MQRVQNLIFRLVIYPVLWTVVIGLMILQQHIGLCCILLAVIFLLSGRSNHNKGSRVAAGCAWFLGVVSVSFAIIGGCLFLGAFRWPVAAMCFIAGTLSVLRFVGRPALKIPASGLLFR
jgi:hypothetical protein